MACEGDRIDASLRFGTREQKCLLAQYDDRSIETRLKLPIRILQSEEGLELAWATRCHYQVYPLRQREPKHRYRLEKTYREEFRLRLWGGSGWTAPPVGSIRLLEEPEQPQLWLSPTLEAIWEETKSLAADLQEAALTLEISSDRDVKVLRLGALY